MPRMEKQDSKYVVALFELYDWCYDPDTPEDTVHLEFINNAEDDKSAMIELEIMINNRKQRLADLGMPAEEIKVSLFKRIAVKTVKTFK